MKPKLNYAELELRIDFTTLAGRLGQLTEHDNPRRKTVFTLLDKMREQILDARRAHKVSYKVLATELTAAGLIVSEPTLRKYVRLHGAEKAARKKASSPSEKQPEQLQNQSIIAPPPAVPNAEEKSSAARRHPRFNFNV